MPAALSHYVIVLFILRGVSSQAAPLACSSMASGSALLQSVNYPNMYFNSFYCSWTLQASPADGLLFLRFLTFATEHGFDFVRIYDDRESSLFNYSGTLVPPSLTLGSRAVVTFTTDGSVSFSGFLIAVSTIDSSPVACSTLISGSGLLQSVNYPYYYVDRYNCSWTLLASPPNGNLYLQFITFATESCCDYVKIYNESGASIFSYSGETLPPSLMLGSQAAVTFTTDGSVVRTGFSIAVSTIGSAVITSSSNLVYNGDIATITCGYGSGMALTDIIMESYIGTMKQGFLWCSVSQAVTVGDGVFYGLSLSGCPQTIASFTTSIAIVASPSLELNYSCSALVTNSNGDEMIMKSQTAYLKVLVLPTIPKFTQSRLVFNNSDEANISCESHNGKPAALLQIAVRSPNGIVASANGLAVSTLLLSPPLRGWHNSTARCSVTNHNFTYLAVATNVIVNYIESRGLPPALDTTNNITSLDCSAYVSSHPGVYYNWSVPVGRTITADSQLSGAAITVLKGQTGLFNCTAINFITLERIEVIFNTSSLSPVLNTVAASGDFSWKQSGIVAMYAVRAVFFAVLLGLLSRVLTSITRIVSEWNGSTEQSVARAGELGNVTNTSLQPIDHTYMNFSYLQTNEEPTYAHLSKTQKPDDTVEYETLG